MSGSFHPPAWKEMTNGGGRPHLSNGPQGGGFEGTTHYMLKIQQRHRRGSSSPMGRVILINAPVDGGENSEDIHTVTVNKSPDGRLGFSVRGGSEHGLGIFVSKVEHDSTAAQAGLTVGDKVLEVNGVSLESITMSSAVKVLTGHNRLRMVVRRVGKIPGLRYSKEKTTWVDLIHRRMVVEENGCTPSNASSDSVLRRIVHLFTTSDDYCLGFNIRGGKEFGLGIYVSKLDPGGLAEQHGIKMGDQILAANGVSFEDITHSNAVEVLKSHTHVRLTIREVGRYPAYKEMVAEYGWLDNLANGFPALSSLGSDTNSSVSSLSSSTPVSSLSGLSQVLFPPIFRSDVVDVGICTEDCSRLQSSTEKTADTAMQTDPTALDFMDQSSPSSLDPNQLVCTETSQTVGETVLLKDTVIRGKGEGPREMGGAREQGPGRVRTLSSGERAAERKYPKTEVLMALSKPQKPIRRSQSHIMVSEKKKRGQQKEKGSVESKTTLQRSKTFVNLLFKKDHKEKSRSSSPSHHPNEKERGRPFHLFTSPRESRAGSPLPHHETLQHVEEMSKKLLSPDEVSAVMRHCRRFLSDNVTENLVRPLLAILDRPEKLLLLREIRTLIPTTELSHFDCLVMPFELEAYDFLKSRSLRSPALRSPRTGTPRRHLITPIPDYRGGFYLQPFHDSQKENQLIEDFERLRLASQPSVYLPPSRAFTHLLDVPVDSYASSTARSRTPSPSPSHSFLPAGSPHNSQQGRQLHHSPNRRETRTKRFDQASFLSVSDRRDTAPERGRSPVRNSDSRGRREGSPDSIYGRQNRQVNCTEVSVLVPSEWRERATPADVFDSPRERRSSPGRGSGLLLNGNFQNGQETRGTPPSEEYEISTLTISKAKQSLGISVSGGNESKIQPVIKIEKVFPGGAASTNEALKAGYELMSVDDVSLQGVTHQHAVDVIRRSFSNKGKDPMVFVVKVPKVSLGPPEL